MRLYGRQGLISGIRVSRRAPSITHLVFADDSLLFFHHDDGQARHIRDLLIFLKGYMTVFEPGEVLPASSRWHELGHC
jgi:hypothetical protein